ncbi:MAG: hypothetical protein Fur0043_01220 [Anaerolineales bacterium]
MTAGLLLLCGLLFLLAVLLLGLIRLNTPASGPTLDLLATLQAATPLTVYPSASPAPTATSAFRTPAALTAAPAPSLSPGDAPTGKIVFTCQIYKVQSSNQICIINADGSGFRRLTTDASRQHYYPSLSPDGNSVVYAAFREENLFELYEMNLTTGEVRQLTDRLGVLNAPEISPDGGTIVFMRWTAQSGQYQIWTMERNGDHPNNIPKITGWDPTWSPDGKRILFASDMKGSIQLYTIKFNGRDLHQVGNLPALRGRSDWSPDGTTIVTYSGEPWKREVYLMNADGSNLRQLTPSGGNSQGPSFSPDGRWVAFTAYFDHPGDIHGCEIYLIRTDGTDLRRLTDNDYCDYQPRWGP